MAFNLAKLEALIGAEPGQNGEQRKAAMVTAYAHLAVAAADGDDYQVALTALDRIMNLTQGATIR